MLPDKNISFHIYSLISHNEDFNFIGYDLPRNDCGDIHSNIEVIFRNKYSDNKMHIYF